MKNDPTHIEEGRADILAGVICALARRTVHAGLVADILAAAIQAVHCEAGGAGEKVVVEAFARAAVNRL
jgi:hypothetical protein